MASRVAPRTSEPETCERPEDSRGKVAGNSWSTLRTNTEDAPLALCICNAFGGFMFASTRSVGAGVGTAGAWASACGDGCGACQSSRLGGFRDGIPLGASARLCQGHVGKPMPRWLQMRRSTTRLEFKPPPPAPNPPPLPQQCAVGHLFLQSAMKRCACDIVGLVHLSRGLGTRGVHVLL